MRSPDQPLRAGDLEHDVLLENPSGAPTPNNEGDFTQTWEPLSPARVMAAIEPATARDLERVVSGTVESTASHLVLMRYHPQVTTKTRITKGERHPDGTLTPGSREFHVTGVQNPRERNERLILTCEEVVA